MQPNGTSNSITAQIYLKGLEIIVECEYPNVEELTERLNIPSEIANDIIIGAEEMGIISKATKKKPSQVKVTSEDFQENADFYQEGIKARMYDFNSIEGIQNIPIPKYENLFCMKSPVNNIEYIFTAESSKAQEKW